MEYLNVLLATLFSIVVLFILTKLMGRRQVSQLSMFDYINGITIGSIAAEMATSLEDDVFKPLIALVVYAMLTLLISVLSCKSHKLRRFFVGKPLILYDNGKLYEKNLLTAKLDVGEFMTECRNSGYFELNELQTAVYEPNGRISFLPAEGKRPVTPEDIGMQPPQTKMPVALIVDGRVLEENLKQSGKDHVWLSRQLDRQGISQKDVFFAVCDSNGTFAAYPKMHIKLKKEMFE